MKYVYDAVFTPEEVGGYSVEVPDIQGCYSQGETLHDAVINIAEAIALCIEDNIAAQEDIPVATFHHEVKEGELLFPVMAEVDPAYVSIGEPYITTAEAGALLGVSDSRIRQLYGAQVLEGRKRGRDLQIARWSVDEYRKERSMPYKQPPSPEEDLACV